MNLKKGVWFLIIFNALYLLAFTFYYISISNYEFLWYISIVALIGIIIGVTINKSKLDYFVLWGLSIWGLLHMLGGGLIINGQTLYKYRIIELVNKGGDFYILKMDQAIHFYGFMIAAIVVFQLINLITKSNSKTSSKPNYKLIIFLAFIGSMGLGALNEVVEFLAFLFIEETGVGGIYNIGFDLIFNMLGALTGSFIQYFRQK